MMIVMRAKKPETVLSFQEFASTIRKLEGRPDALKIDPSTRIERDLGIVGDDGFDLLGKLENKFGFRFGANGRAPRQVFKLAPKELLFSPEGVDVVGLVLWLLRRPRNVKQLTVGELYEIVVYELRGVRA
jgi:hypothetical protein